MDALLTIKFIKRTRLYCHKDNDWCKIYNCLATGHKRPLVINYCSVGPVPNCM